MNFPENLLYTSTHEWTLLEGATATVGITDYAQSELGDIIFVEAPAVGTSVKAGEPMGSIEAVKTVSDIYAPFSGEISAVNPVLDETPETINKDPYGGGWIVKIKVSDSAPKEQFLSASKYQASIGH